MPKILLLGATGYIGQAFQSELNRRRWDAIPLSRSAVDYTQFEPLLGFLRESRPDFLVNAAGYTGKPNVDACESAKAETIAGNVVLPLTISHACHVAGIPWGNVSSGCIYSGAHVQDNVSSRVEPNLMRPDVLSVWENNRAALRGFTEEDEPNFSFKNPPCSFYSGTKALGEEVLARSPQTYIWRLRIPFDQYDNSRNYLSKMQRYSRLLQSANSLSHRADFARACLDLWERRAAFGIYNVTNPGWITTRDVVGLIQKHLPSQREYQFFSGDTEFYSTAAQTPRSNCVMDSSKLLSAGVTMRPVLEALDDALRHWQPEKETKVA